MMILLLISSIFIFFCSDVINAALSSHEQTWLTNNPSVTNPQEAAQKAAKRVEFESHGYSDVNLFRTYWKWSQENPQGTWDTFATSSQFRDYNTRQNLIQSLITSGFTDSKWHSSFFSWSSKSNSVDISTWTQSQEYATTQTYLTKRAECISQGFTDYEFGYYYAWYQNHISDADNGVDTWKHSLDFREMRDREQKREEIKAAGYEENLWFRAYWDFHKKFPGKSILDWQESYDYLLTQYREQKRAELISHGYSDKKQFNEFWRWFQTSPSYIDPGSPHVTPKDADSNAVRWNGRLLASTSSITHARCRCATSDATKGLSVCNKGCGDPDKVCSNSFGCTDIQKGCNADMCTCQPYGLTGDRDYTFSECEQQCSRLGMLIPWSLESLGATVSTGCSANKEHVWLSPHHNPNVPTQAPSPRPPVQRYTIDQGLADAWADTKTPRYSTEKAWCRCTNTDETKGLSICLSGCGISESTGQCSPSYGCGESRENNNGCSNPNCQCLAQSSITSSDMTYDECVAQCAVAGMVIPSSYEGVSKAQSTGCSINGRRMWIDFTPGS